MSTPRRSLTERFFLDEHNKVVVYQRPNLPQIAGWAALLAAWPLTNMFRTVALAISYGAFFTWAWQEIFQGANYFRRSLGLIGLAVILYLAVSRLFA